MIIHDILTKSFCEKYKILKKVNDKDFFSIKDNAFLRKHNVAFKTVLYPT